MAFTLKGIKPKQKFSPKHPLPTSVHRVKATISHQIPFVLVVDQNSRPMNNNANSRNTFGPVSYTQMILLSRPSLHKKSPEKVEENLRKEIKDDDGHKFLLRKMEKSTEYDEHSQDNIEVQRTERSEFVRMMTLATTQDENFQP